MQTATSETEIKSLYLSICVHHYTLRAPCPKGQGIQSVSAYMTPLCTWSTVQVAGLLLTASPHLQDLTNEMPSGDSVVCKQLNTAFSCALGRKIPQLQLLSEKSHTATVPKVFQIGLCGVVEADLELFCNGWNAGFLGERLYMTCHITRAHILGY